MKIFDAMVEMKDVALRENRSPQRWEINDAGVSSLMIDGRLEHLDLVTGLVGKPFLGIPIAMMPPGTKRASSDPKVDLIVDEIVRRR
ncbi:hypothetical protein [Sphingobium sp. YG1]|uniref:hypothetical protein n=1 Tax=Sphingobium sp. YG1 TaxID=2082188 RepID=UPI000DBB0DB7|nr:hypothetical protein [Sphingobium sp. YG1]BBC99135.1 hypothetical protein YGS_C1P0391 [Sphingobium sp. YG1]